MGKWMSYKVDKMLPTSIAAIAADNEHWVPYCEKAYAKERFQIDQASNSDWLRVQTYLKSFPRDIKHMKISQVVGVPGD